MSRKQGNNGKPASLVSGDDLADLLLSGKVRAVADEVTAKQPNKRRRQIQRERKAARLAGAGTPQLQGGDGGDGGKSVRFGSASSGSNKRSASASSSATMASRPGILKKRRVGEGGESSPSRGGAKKRGGGRGKRRRKTASEEDEDYEYNPDEEDDSDEDMTGTSEESEDLDDLALEDGETDDHAQYMASKAETAKRAREFQRRHRSRKASGSQAGTRTRTRSAAAGRRAAAKIIGGDSDEESDDESGGSDDDAVETLEEKRQRSALLRQLPREEQDRYSVYRRAMLDQKIVKEFIGHVLGQKMVSDQLTVALSTVTKLFVCDVVEESRKVMVERGDVGPIRPVHLREAHRRLQAQNKAPSVKKPSVFRRYD